MCRCGYSIGLLWSSNSFPSVRFRPILRPTAVRIAVTPPSLPPSLTNLSKTLSDTPPSESARDGALSPEGAERPSQNVSARASATAKAARQTVSSPAAAETPVATKGAANFLEKFNLRRVYYWLGLSGLVGIVGGLGALGFKWLTDVGMQFFWGDLISMVPGEAGGEPAEVHLSGGPRLWALILAPALGGAISALLVYGFAPQAEGHGTDAAIKAYHRNRGRIGWRIPIVKLLASAATLASGGVPAGRARLPKSVRVSAACWAPG